ncbi:MAG: DUF4070 domain-containing protein [Calditrichia bacterium]
MNILLIYPEAPDTFWSFRAALKFISKKSSEPPLGLITIAGLLPSSWNKKLVDMNVSALSDSQIRWADYVFLSGMNVHLKSMKEVIGRCKKLGAKIVLGGPYCTVDSQEFEDVDHLVLNEAEITLPMFLRDLENGNPKHVYQSGEFPDLSLTPQPAWELLEKDKYSCMSVQYSRGCPYNCEFCAITVLNGRRPRTKSKEQFIGELESLYQFGWTGSVFIVDDNFIGNKIKLKKEILPALIEWGESCGFPFNYTTEVSINLSDDEELVELMARAGFDHAFVGIETTNEDSLTECGKSQNKQRDLVAFIVGFDNDPPNIFQQQIRFIQKSGIVTAMVGLLNAPSGTRLYERLKRENRLLKVMSGNNTDGSTNFIPKMDYHKLIEGYREIIHTIYSPAAYYERVKTFISDYRKVKLATPIRIQPHDVRALFKSFWVLGAREKGRRFFWKLLLFSLLKYPQNFPLAVRMAIYGFHFRQVSQTI